MMKGRQHFFLILALAALGGLALACNLSGEPAASGGLELEAAAPRQEVSAGEITPFHVSVGDTGSQPYSVRIGLEPAQAAAQSGSWKTAICYDTHCFMQAGNERLDEPLTIGGGAGNEFEIKMFVPEAARPGDSYSVIFSVALAGSPDRAASIELTGYLP